MREPSKLFLLCVRFVYAEKTWKDNRNTVAHITQKVQEEKSWLSWSDSEQRPLPHSDILPVPIPPEQQKESIYEDF